MQEPHERQPQLARERHRPVIDQHFGGVGGADDLEQIAQLRRVGRQEPRPVSQGCAGTRFAELGGGARQIERAAEIRDIERRETPA